jgi:hypothetical protein
LSPMKKRLLSWLILLTLLSCRNRPTAPIPAQTIPPLTNREIEIDSIIPRYVRLDTLLITGRAVNYDTLICDTRIDCITGLVSDSGVFSIRVPVQADRMNIWDVFARDRYKRSSDTIRVSFIHTLSDSIQLQQALPRYTNQNPLFIRGGGLGFSTVTCMGEAGRSKTRVLNQGFEISAPLKPNVPNRLFLFAEDSLGVFSDTLEIDIIHDDIPPAPVSASVLTDSVSYPLKKPIKIEFDCPLSNAALSLTGEGYHIDPPVLVWDKGARSFQTSNSRIIAGMEYLLMVSALDSAGNRFDAVWPFKTYYKALRLGRAITTAWMSQSLDRLYLLTTDPNGLIAIDTRTWQVQRQIRLSYPPTCGAENPFNGRIYITSRWTGFITVVDPDLEREEQFLLCDDGSGTDSEPIGIAFSSDGVGIVRTNQWEMRMIDSRAGNFIHKHPDLSRTGSADPVPVAYNGHEKLILAGMGGSYVDFYSYDYRRNEFRRILQDYSFDYCHVAIGHPFKPVIAFQVGHSSYVLDAEETLLGPVSIDRPFAFTNLPGEDHILYYCSYSESEVVVFDVEKNAKVQSAGYAFRFRDPSSLAATLDGSYLVLIYGDNGDLTVVEPKMFRD